MIVQYVRVRNSEWESDGELQRELSKYVTKVLQRNKILSYRLQDFPRYSWSIRTLDRRMRYFNIFYHDKSVSLNAVKEAVKRVSVFSLNEKGKPHLLQLDQIGSYLWMSTTNSRASRRCSQILHKDSQSKNLISKGLVI